MAMMTILFCFFFSFSFFVGGGGWWWWCCWWGLGGFGRGWWLLIEVEVAFFEIIVWLSHDDRLKNCHFKIWSSSATEKNYMFGLNEFEEWWCYCVVLWLITFQLSLQTFWKGERNVAIFISCCSARNLTT